MVLTICFIIAVLIAAILSALLLPMKLYFSASGGSDEEAALSARIMLFNGLVGGGFKFENKSLRITFFLGSLQVISFKAAAAIRKIRKRKKKEDAAQKQDALHEKEKEKGVKSQSLSFLERIAGWQLQVVKYKKYYSIFIQVIRSIIHIDYCRIRLALCFEDPALTGKAAGLIFTINSLLPKTCSIQPEWDFSKRLFHGKAALKLTFRQYLFWWYLVKLYYIIRKKSEDTVAFTGYTLKTQEA